MFALEKNPKRMNKGKRGPKFLTNELWLRKGVVAKQTCDFRRTPQLLNLLSCCGRDVPLAINWIEANNLDHLIPIVEDFPGLSDLIDENRVLCDLISNHEDHFSRQINLGRRLVSILNPNNVNFNLKTPFHSNDDAKMLVHANVIETFGTDCIDHLNQIRKTLREEIPFFCIVDTFEDSLLQDALSELMNYNRILCKELYSTNEKLRRFHSSTIISLQKSKLIQFQNTTPSEIPKVIHLAKREQIPSQCNEDRTFQYANFIEISP